MPVGRSDEQPASGRTSIVVQGELYTKESCDELTDQVAAARTSVMVSFRNVRAVSSYAIRSLLSLQARSEQEKRPLVLSEVKGPVAQIFSALHLHRILKLEK